MRWWTVGIGLLVAAALGAALGARLLSGSSVPRTSTPDTASTAGRGARVYHHVLRRETLHVDLYVPQGSEPSAERRVPAPWLILVHERGWPAPDEKERAGPAMADALQRRGIGVALVSFLDEAVADGGLRKTGEEIAAAIRELTPLAAARGLHGAPVLAGDLHLYARPTQAERDGNEFHSPFEPFKKHLPGRRLLLPSVSGNFRVCREKWPEGRRPRPTKH